MRILSSEILHRIQGRIARLYGEAVTPRLMDRLGLLAGRYAGLAGRLAALRGGWDQSDAVLITYGDMVRTVNEKPLVTLRRFLNRRLHGVFSAVHILPFFPYSSDEGFSVIDYRVVDATLGSWPDIEAIGADRRLMVDLVLNHVSRRSAWFNDYVNGVAPARHYFMSVDPATDLSAVVRPRSRPLLTRTETRRGPRYMWSTFSDDQIDLNFTKQDVLFEFLDILLSYVEHGARVIRLDAIAYLWKRIGTPCIHLPETHEVVRLLRDVLDLLAPGVWLLTETNVPHAENVAYFGEGDEAHMVYQFSLPPLLLHALLTGHTRYLSEWAASLSQPPPGCAYLNFTASHDGIGVRPLEGLVPAEEIRAIGAAVERRGGHVSMRATADGAESPYELNITYFDAMADPDERGGEWHVARFLCSQSVMLALRGIPAVYLHSLTATHNDHQGVERSSQPRSINRRRWREAELNALLDDPSTSTARVFEELTRLLRVRAQHAAFHPDAPQRVLDLPDGLFGVERSALDGSETVYAVSNLSDSPRVLDLAASIAGAAEAHWDLHAHQALEAVSELHLAPYASVWLEAREGVPVAPDDEDPPAEEAAP